MKNTKVTAYLDRINLGDCNNDLHGLFELQKHHMENIPFENLDVVVGRKIELEEEHLFDKIITKKRGGYCFELNLLYAKLLASFGFSPTPVLGRVWLRNPKKTPPRNHLAHLVKIDEETYLTDVGFGGQTTRVPLNINDSSPVKDKDGIVRIVPFAKYQFMIQRQIENGWANQYSFEQVDISEVDIIVGNHFMSTHPLSHFMHDNFIGKYNAEGRVGLFNHQLSRKKGLEVYHQQEISYGEEWLEVIQKEFQMQLDFSEKEMGILFGK